MVCFSREIMGSDNEYLSQPNKLENGTMKWIASVCMDEWMSVREVTDVSGVGRSESYQMFINW